MKKYTKQFITALLFMIGLVCILLAASYVTVPKNNDPDSGIEQIDANGVLGEKPGTVDVLFLGDSEAHSTFVPLRIWSDTGYTSYNCGTGDQTMDYSYTLLKSNQKSGPQNLIPGGKCDLQSGIERNTICKAL